MGARCDLSRLGGSSRTRWAYKAAAEAVLEARGRGPLEVDGLVETVLDRLNPSERARTAYAAAVQREVREAVFDFARGPTGGEARGVRDVMDACPLVVETAQRRGVR